MATTLDGKALTVTKWGENVQTRASQWDAWENQECKRKIKVYGITRTYMVECVEQNAAWTDSLVNYFEQTEKNGSSVVLSSDRPTRPVNNVSVYVLNVSFSEENLGTQNIRRFTLTLQET